MSACVSVCVCICLYLIKIYSACPEGVNLSAIIIIMFVIMILLKNVNQNLYIQYLPYIDFGFLILLPFLVINCLALSQLSTQT